MLRRLLAYTMTTAVTSVPTTSLSTTNSSVAQTIATTSNVNAQVSAQTPITGTASSIPTPASTAISVPGVPPAANVSTSSVAAPVVSPVVVAGVEQKPPDGGSSASAPVVSAGVTAGVASAPDAAPQSSGSNTAVPNVQPSSAPTNANDLTDVLSLRFRGYVRPYGLPDYVSVCQAAYDYFGEKIQNVISIRMGAETIYKIELKEKVSKLGHKVLFNIQNKATEIPLYYHENTNNANPIPADDRDKNVVLTIKNAGRNEYLHIPGGEFDKVIKSFKLSMVLLTKLQRKKDAPPNTYNGNRLCVVEKPANLNSIPNSINVYDVKTGGQRRFNIWFPGQQRPCPTCIGQTHVGPCPVMEEFKKVRAERTKMENDGEITTAIISDSTLRFVDPIGLRAEVTTMSGGALGQTLQVIEDDPVISSDEVKNVVVMAGENDTKNAMHDIPERFCMDIDKSLEKAVYIAKKFPQKTITLVTAQKIPETPPVDTLEGHEKAMKDRYIRERISTLKEVEFAKTNVNVDNLNTIHVKYEIDEKGHPSVDETRKILHQINDELELQKPLIWKDSHLTSNRIYRWTKTLFKYGCNHCERAGYELDRSHFNNSNLCDECHEVMATLDLKGKNMTWDRIVRDKTRELAKKKSKDREKDHDEEEEGKRKKSIKEDVMQYSTAASSQVEGKKSMEVDNDNDDEKWD